MDEEQRARRREAGRKGGAIVKARHGRAHYAYMGVLGGMRTRDTYTAKDPDYYRKLGHKSAQARRQRKAAGE